MIKEITSKEYAKQTGMAHGLVRKFCRLGHLSCRKIKSDGSLIVDYTKHKQGVWYVDTTIPIKTLK